ncbi:MAG: hypothetical protein M3071_14200 [Actinomycetota bacterium]|nr:hypothetical protein [Actinomycetota bacterium]
MDRLRARDLRAVLGAAQELRGAESAAGFPSAVIDVMERVVAADVPSYNEVDLPGRTIVAVAPKRALFPHAEELVGRYVHQNPTVSYFARTADGSARKLSDFVSTRALHKLDLYNLVYRPVGLEHMIALVLPRRWGRARSPVTQLRLSLGRATLDFSERDRDVLNALRPFLARAKYYLDEVDELRATIRRLERGAVAAERLIVVLDRGARVTDASVPAAKLLRWLGWRPSADLPEPLGSWVRQHRSDDAHVKPLVLEAPNGRLSARLLRGRGSDPDVVMLEPVDAETSLDSLRVRGLSDARRSFCKSWRSAEAM